MHNEMKPDHIKDFSEVNPKEVDYFTENLNWFTELSFKGRLITGENDFFYIFYSGIKYEDGLIATNDETPLTIWAQPNNQDEKILLFDERIHGYNATLIEKKKFSDNFDIHQYIDDDGQNSFHVYCWTNSSIDFEDEFEVNLNGEIQILDGFYKSIDYLIKNAFDYIGILLKNSKGLETRIVDMELA